MNETDPAQPAASQSGQRSLFDAQGYPGDAFCEAFASPAQPYAHWQPLMRALDVLGSRNLQQHQERARRMRHEDGATYNPFDDAAGTGTPWALEIIPQPLTAAEWSGLESGLIQRALLLEKILQDVYGPQELLKNGRLPAELIYANPNFLHACHGVQPAGGRNLTFYAADLYRGVDGRFRVLRDYAACPAGLGYALENRIVISRIFSKLYHQTQILRLAPFFHTFHRSLVQRVAPRRENPDIVLLSPGPDSRIYFEHAMLSRYLGYPLVESQDLTVRNGEVFLKKLAGLERVEAIFRHLSDHSIDPFALRRETAAGVAGLIQVSLEGNIDIVSPIGAGLVETPALSPFLPSLSALLTGEQLLLEGHPAWWCGTDDGLQYVNSHLPELTVVPAMDPSAAPAADPSSTLREMPHQWLGREAIRPAVLPAWNRDGIAPRYSLLRVFACATEDGFTVMPGGLAITAPDVDTLLLDAPESQQSKDVWVLSDQPVTPFSLMGSLRTVAEFSRGSDLPSRVADHLLWLGRYLERAEGLVRVLRSVFRRLAGESRPGDIPELSFLINLLRSKEALDPASDDDGDIPRFRELYAQLNEVLYGADRTESVVSILDKVRRAARNVRDRLSLDAWRAINRLESFGDLQAEDPLEVLDDTLFTLSAFSGLAMESMTRGLGWRFMDMGRRVERAMHQTRLIGYGLSRLCVETGSALEALLEVSDSIMTYRARYRAAFQLSPVLDLLIVDESNPKSIAFQLSQLAAHVDHLPRHTDRRYASPEERMTLQMLTDVRLLDLSTHDCKKHRNKNTALAAFLETLGTQLKAFSQHVSAHFLSRVPATPHYSLKRDKSPK